MIESSIFVIENDVPSDQRSEDVPKDYYEGYLDVFKLAQKIKGE